MPVSYITTDAFTTAAGTETSIRGNSFMIALEDNLIQASVEKTNKTKGISPQLYFKYVKKNFSLIQNKRIEFELKKLEKAFNVAVEDGHIGLSEKLFEQCCEHAKEMLLYSKGIKYFITKEQLYKHKNSLQDGNIADTLFENYTRFIPKKTLKKKKELENIFDTFIIFHYYSSKQKDVKKMTSSEKFKMKDPILFGKLDNVNKLYFIDDWEDEYCDLTFANLVDLMNLDDNEITIKRHPDFFNK